MTVARAPHALRGLLHPGVGPVVRLRLHGASGAVPGVGVLDTGASISVVDRDLARALTLASPGAAQWSGVTDQGGRSASMLRRVRMELVGDDRLFELDMAEAPGIRGSVPGLPVVCLIGWDFLDACRLVCDGPAGAFELTLPAPVRNRRR
jgi:hypothetical protein